MAKDIKELFKNDQKLTNEKMPLGHQERFFDRLDKAMPQHTKPKFNWLNIAASLVLLFGLSFGAYNYFQDEQPIAIVDSDTPNVQETKTLGDISPDLKKVEDYYLANINLELSKVKLTPENKELFDGYVLRLEELNAEYNRLSIELTKEGPNELTVNALINNLKFRLNLLYRLKEQLKTLNTIGETQA